MNERKLVKKAIKGNEEAFEELLIIHSNPLMIWLYSSHLNKIAAIATIKAPPILVDT